MGRTFGETPANDDADQLAPPAELMERDPDPYGDKAAAAALAANGEQPPVIGDRLSDFVEDPEVIDVAAIAAGDDDVIDPRTVAVPEPVEAPGTAVALVERWSIDTDSGEVWPYDFLEFEGDKLGIRLPTRQALAAFSLASSKYVSVPVKNDLTGLFIARHLSPESYGRVFSRLMDPDDDAYTVDTVGELFNAIVTAAIDADEE